MKKRKKKKRDSCVSMLPEWCAKLVRATHTKSPQSCCIPHPAHVGSAGWEGKRGGAAALASPAWAGASIAVAGAPEAVRGDEPGPGTGGLPSLPRSQQEASKMAKLNALSVAFFFFFLLWERVCFLKAGGKNLFVLKILKRRRFQEKGEKKGNVSIWVHLYNIPFGAVVWLTSVGRAPSYRNLSSGSLARETHETTTTLLLCGRFKQGI